MHRTVFVVTLLSLLALGGPAQAELCTIDAVPAATLLLPYFAVDLDANPGKGVNTLFSINNASAAPAIAHVSIWSDWSQPVLDFDIFLTGYDVQSVSLYRVFVDGILPVTADEQSDQGVDVAGFDRAGDPTSKCTNAPDSCSPHGVNPEWDGSFTGAGIPAAGVADCIDIFPFFVNPLLSVARRDELRCKLTGQDCGTGCFGADHGDSIARGYITIDNANACSLIFPNDPGYFSDGVNPGVASNVNQLWGDWFVVDPFNAFAQGDNLVSIEADDQFTGGATGYTFYRRYTDAINPSEDNREPLATSWASRYLNGGAFDVTTLTVWRDATIVDIDENGHVCGAPGDGDTGPAWHPMNETQVVAFDECENWEEVCGAFFGPPGPPISPPDDPDFGDPVCFPLETQNVAVGADPLGPLASDFGWLYLNLAVGIDDGGGAPDYDPGSDGTLAQSYVITNHSALGLFSVGLPAVQLTSACDDVNVVLFEQ